MAFESTSSNGPAPPPSDFHIIRYTVFLTLEAAFTGLAWYCYVRPRPLPESLGFQDTTIKSGFIVFFSVWHTIAVTCAYSICGETFSREWAAVPGDETDAVSTVTSGIIDRISYFPKPRATKTYRFAFLAFLSLLFMRTTGPSAITVSSGIDFSQNLLIGSLTTASLTQNLTDLESKNFLTRLVQASMVVRLERLIGVPWGYEPEPNWFIPLPNENSLQLVDKVVYTTDLVHFHHTCLWKAPSSSPKMNTFTFDNKPWSWRFLGPSNDTAFGSNTSCIINGSSIVQLLPESNSGTGKSVFLVLGGNSSFPVNSTHSSQAWVDLSGQPSLYNPEGFPTYNPTSLKIDWIRAPLASLLVCDPHLTFTTRRVSLYPVANITASDVTLATKSLFQPPSPKNIDPVAAGTLFTSVLTVAVGLQDIGAAVNPIDYLNVNSVATEMFLHAPADRNWANASAVQPFSIETINQHVDIFTLSALKAFTSHYKANSDITYAEGGVYETSVDVYSTRLSLALATSVPFAVFHTVLFGLLGIVLAIIAHLNTIQNRYPFILVHIKQA